MSRLDSIAEDGPTTGNLWRESGTAESGHTLLQLKITYVLRELLRKDEALFLGIKVTFDILSLHRLASNDDKMQLHCLTSSLPSCVFLCMAQKLLCDLVLKIGSRCIP